MGLLPAAIPYDQIEISDYAKSFSGTRDGESVLNVAGALAGETTLTLTYKSRSANINVLFKNMTGESYTYNGPNGTVGELKKWLADQVGTNQESIVIVLGRYPPSDAEMASEAFKSAPRVQFIVRGPINTPVRPSLAAPPMTPLLVGDVFSRTARGPIDALSGYTLIDAREKLIEIQNDLMTYDKAAIADRLVALATAIRNDRSVSQ